MGVAVKVKMRTLTKMTVKTVRIVQRCFRIDPQVIVEVDLAVHDFHQKKLSGTTIRSLGLTGTAWIILPAFVIASTLTS